MAASGRDLAQRLQELEAENRALQEEVRRLKGENRRWARLAGTDALTGLPNKVSFMRALAPQAIQRASKERDTIGFILLSADNLGDLNEDYGREAGDQVIRGLGNLLQSILGDEGRLGHIDGANFAVVLFPSDLDAVRARANMLRARVRSHAFPCAETTAQITVSAGIAALEPPEASNGRDLTETAFHALDRALYTAKQAGGNRVEAVQNLLSEETGRKEPSL